MLPRMRAGVIEPSLVVLAKKYNQDKKICRMCAALIPAQATPLKDAPSTRPLPFWTPARLCLS